MAITEAEQPTSARKPLTCTDSATSRSRPGWAWASGCWPSGWRSSRSSSGPHLRAHADRRQGGRWRLPCGPARRQARRARRDGRAPDCAASLRLRRRPAPRGRPRPSDRRAPEEPTRTASSKPRRSSTTSAPRCSSASPPPRRSTSAAVDKALALSRRETIDQVEDRDGSRTLYTSQVITKNAAVDEAGEALYAVAEPRGRRRRRGADREGEVQHAHDHDPGDRRTAPRDRARGVDHA